MDYSTHPYFVADDTAGSRKETAILLVGTAREHGVPQREIASTRGGFYITERLADLVYDDEDEQDAEGDTEGDTEESSDTKTSGNRAAKKNSKEE